MVTKKKLEKYQRGGAPQREETYNESVSKKLEDLYKSEKYQQANKLEKVGMIAEIDPLSLFEKSLGAGIAMTGIPSLLKSLGNLTLEKATLGVTGLGATGVTGLMAGNLLSDPIKNKINRAAGANVYRTKTASDINVVNRDTTIDLSNNNLSFSRIGEKEPANMLLGGEFIERSDDSVRKAKDWINPTKKTYSDKGLKVGDIKDYYGVENGIFKVGSPQDFDKETLIVPNRFGNEKIAKASVIDGGLRLTSNDGNVIYNNTPNGGKLILYSPTTKKSSFISFNKPLKGAEEINNFIIENKDAQPIIIDNGRYRSYINNPKGISDENYDNYYSLDVRRENNPGYNILINSGAENKDIMTNKKKNKLEKYQNGSEVGFIPSITNIFSQGLGIAPNISNPNGNPFGSNPFGGQLTNNIFNTGQDLQGLFGQEFQNQKPMSYSDWLKKGNRNDDLVSKTMYQAYEKVFNKQLEDNRVAFEQATPLAANMTALDELNKMSTLEYNKGLKRDFSDVSNDPRGMESRGIFQQGGNPKEKVFPSIQEFMNKKAEFINKYTDEAEKRQELLRQRLSFDGLPEDKVEEVLEIIFTEIPDDLDNDKPEVLQSKLVERIKNETGYFLPNAQKEVTDIFKLDNIYRTTMGDFNNMRLQMENPTETPKKLSEKKFKYLKQGGTINALQQALGYKDNSPFKELPSQTILRNMSADGVNITMDGVSKDLYLVPDVGRPVKAKGNSGEYYFPKATKVEEIPSFQNSGVPTNEPELQNGKFGHLDFDQKLTHLKVLKDYVQKYGIDALKESPEDFNFFVQAIREAQQPDPATTTPAQGTPNQDPPLEGGDPLDPYEVEIKGKRVQEKKEEKEEQKSKKVNNIAERLRNPYELTTERVTIFDDLLAELNSQKNTLQQEQLYRKRLRDMFSMQQEQQAGQDPQSNIYTGRGRFQQGGVPSFGPRTYDITKINKAEIEENPKPKSYKTSDGRIIVTSPDGGAYLQDVDDPNNYTLLPTFLDDVNRYGVDEAAKRSVSGGLYKPHQTWSGEEIYPQPDYETEEEGKAAYEKSKQRTAKRNQQEQDYLENEKIKKGKGLGDASALQAIMQIINSDPKMKAEYDKNPAEFLKKNFDYRNGGRLNIFQQGGNTSNLTKLDTDKGAPYEYYYDNTTEDYYIKTPSGQLTKTEKGSDTYNKMANRYGTTIYKKETHQKPLNGKIIRDESDPYDYFYDEETKRYAFRKRGETDLWRIVDPNSSRGAAIKKVVDEAVEYNNGLKGTKKPKGFIEDYLIDPIKDLFGFQNGGVLKYQLGGNPKPLYENPSNPNSINQVYGQEKQGMTEAERSAREFHENEMDSPGYFKKVRDMLPASIPEFKRDYEAANVIKARKAALREARNTGATIPSTSDAAGQYNSNRGTVSFQGKSSQTIDYQGEKLEMNEQHPHQNVGTNVHELSHASTRGGDFELQDEANYMRNRAKGTDPYYTKPEEIKARMDVLKAYAVSNGWIKPGENISKKHLEMIGLKSKLGDGTDGAANAYKELIEKAGLTDDDLVDIWKNIASAPSNTSDVSTMARNGGRINMFQQGGSAIQQMTPEELIRSYADRGMTWDQPKLTPEELIRSYTDKNRTSGSISESAKRENVLREFLKSYENPNIDWNPPKMTPEELIRSYVNKGKTTGSISESAKRESVLRDFLKSYENPNIDTSPQQMTPEELIMSVIQRGATKKKQGGQVAFPILNLSGKTNPLRLNPQGMYKFGGLITEGSEYNKRKQPKKNPISGASKTGPMGPKDVPSYDSGIRAIIDQEENEIIPTDNLIPIQTEVGELIILPTGDIVPVMAKKRHHKMDEDEVTDIAPEGAYILSAHGQVRIKKDEADRVITETGIKPYRLGQGQDAPTEKTLADMMNKKEMSPADVGRIVSQKFPVVATSNPYEAAANTENKINRKPYLEGIIQLSEFDKMRKGIDTSTPEATREYRDENGDVGEYTDGGNTMERDNILHAPFPAALAIGLGSSLLQGITGLIGASAQKKDAQRAYQDVHRMAVESAKQQRAQIGLGAAAGIMGTLGQDPRVNPLVLDPTYIRQMQTRIPDQVTDSIANQAYANMPDYRNLPANQQLMGSQAAYAQALKAAGDSRLAAYQQSIGLANTKLQAMQGYADKNRQELESAKRATTLNTNQMLGNVGDRTQGYFDSSATIEANLGQTQVGARLGQAAANQQAIKSYVGSINGMIGTAGAAAYDYYSNRTTPPQNPYTGQATTGSTSWVNPGNIPTSSNTPTATNDGCWKTDMFGNKVFIPGC